LLKLATLIVGFDNWAIANTEYSSTPRSSYDLNRYVIEAHRPLEAALGRILISILLVALNPRLVYHSNTVCLFDFNEEREREERERERERETIVNSIREARIDANCMKAIRSSAPAVILFQKFDGGWRIKDEQGNSEKDSGK
jgi:hypothetical protein